MRLRLGNQKLLAIDWDRKTLRLVLVRPRADGVDLLKAVSLAIPSEVRMDQAESLGAFIRESVREARVGAKRVVLTIPREQVVLNTLALPPTPAEELAAIVGFQIPKELPFPTEQATLDFAICGEHDPRAACNVLVAAVRNEDLSFYLKVAEAAQLSLERIGLRPYSNLLAVEATSPQLAKQTLLLVEVGPHLTEIDIVRSGELRFSRAATVALPIYGEGSIEAVRDSRISSLAVTEREPDEAARHAVAELMVEIVRSFEAYRATDPSISLDHIVVCGASGLEAQLAQALGARFATRAELYSPDRALDLTPQRARELRGFSAALGLALAHGRKGLGYIDFLHPKKPVSRKAQQMRKLPVAVATALLFIGAGFSFHWRFIRPKQQEVERLADLRDEMKKEAESVKAFKEQVEALEGWIESEQHWPEVLTTLTEVFPTEREAYVLRMDFESVPRPKANLRDSRVGMRFRTASLGTVNELNKKLADAGFGSVVPGKETASERSNDGYKYDTSIEASIPLRKPPKLATPFEPEAVPSAATEGQPAASPTAAVEGSATGAAGPPRKAEPVTGREPRRAGP